MKTECSIVKDLLPLYIEDMVSLETTQFIDGHLQDCPECRAELENVKSGDILLAADGKKSISDTDNSRPFKAIMKRMNRQFYSLAYFLVIFFIFLGFSWTGGENLMYNSLIMPIVGIFGYYVFRWQALYKMPVLLLIIDIIACLFKLVELDLYSAVLWTMIYSLFVYVGIAIAFLLHFAFRKENNR